MRTVGRAGDVTQSEHFEVFSGFSWIVPLVEL
jgi:hypothetical protein